MDKWYFQCQLVGHVSRRRGGFSAFEQTVKADVVARTPLEPPALATCRVDLSVDQANELLESLRIVSMSSDLQDALAAIRERHGAFKKREAVAHALGKAWKSPLKTAGFSINASGFPQMISAIRALQPLTRTASEEVERQLGFPLGALFGAHAGSMKESRVSTSVVTAAPDVVEILVRQPAEPSHLVAVPTDSTVRHVKEALAEKLARPEITIHGSIMATEDKVPLPDSHPLGDVRDLTITGVSLSANVAQADVRKRPVNMGEAKELLKVFKEICGSPDFQRTRDNIHRQGPKALERAYPMFIGTMFNATMEMYDFPTTPEAYQEMAQGIGRYGWNTHVKSSAFEVERLLRLPLGGFFQIAPSPGDDQLFPPLPEVQPLPQKRGATADPTSRGRLQGQDSLVHLREGEVGILVRHAVEHSTLRIGVQEGATFLDIKHAIAQTLDCDDILTRGRLVHKTSGMFQTYQDAKPIGSIRELLVLGASLLRKGDVADDGPPVQSAHDATAAPSAVGHVQPPQPAVPHRHKHGEGAQVQQVEKLISPKNGPQVDDSLLTDGEPEVQGPWTSNGPAATGAASVRRPAASQSRRKNDAERSKTSVVPNPQPREVLLEVTHALEPGRMTLAVHNTSTILQVRRTLMEALGEKKLSQVKIVERFSSGFQSIPDDHLVNDRKRLLLLGRSLPGPSDPLCLEVLMDGRRVSLSVQRKASVGDVLALLASEGHIRGHGSLRCPGPEAKDLTHSQSIADVMPCVEFVAAVTKGTDTVSVVVEHVKDGTRLTVSVQASACVLDLRRSVMQTLSEMKLSAVKIVDKNDARAIPDDHKIGADRKFFMLGRSLQPGPSGASREREPCHEGRLPGVAV